MQSNYFIDIFYFIYDYHYKTIHWQNEHTLKTFSGKISTYYSDFLEIQFSIQNSVFCYNSLEIRLYISQTHWCNVFSAFFLLLGVLMLPREAGVDIFYSLNILWFQLFSKTGSLVERKYLIVILYFIFTNTKNISYSSSTRY